MFNDRETQFVNSPRGVYYKEEVYPKSSWSRKLLLFKLHFIVFRAVKCCPIGGNRVSL
ncbi:hypothetical protein POTOM_025883 [Populus tomentosa]|uniref:Uncharacterized protein n=1 Tax=Populus tomentosa TaxID=118781 RepID=A0A8X7ZPX9_POPTO|nr:hypothetical protein POTOM_025883 [Populus tomentosa]